MTQPTEPKRKRGRPPLAQTKVRRSYRIAPDVAEYLSTTDDATATIEAAVRKTKEFREWRKSDEQ